VRQKSDGPTVEVRESKVRDTGVDVVRRVDWQGEEYPAHIPDGCKETVLRQLADHTDGYAVVSAEEAALIETVKETLCD
jgi:hypothetical protein